jgi:uncharacterized repeat protein (TIGR03943 family)
MLKSWGMLKNLAETILKPAFERAAEPKIEESTNDPAIDIWVYAEPAGEEADPLKRNVLQWRRLISSVREPLNEFPGQAVKVVGFVHRNLGDAPNQFTIARQIIRCCLADTVPLGLVVQWEEPIELATWLQVEGVFVKSGANSDQLAIAPTQVKIIPQPQKCYINGVF